MKMNLSLKLTFADSRVQSRDPAWNYLFILNNYMPLITMTSGRWPNTFICLANVCPFIGQNGTFFADIYMIRYGNVWSAWCHHCKVCGWGGGSNHQAPVVKKRLVWQITHYYSISQCCYKYFSNIRENWYAD